MTATVDLDHENVFAQAWADPHNTCVERPPVDVNAVLAEYYHLSEPLQFTRTQLWDMEVRKAYRPDIYISSVVQEGSAATWARRELGGGHESFYRKSMQRGRLSPGYGLVLEQVRINPDFGKVTFIGAAQLPGPDGETLVAGTNQPLFHVEHVATGAETHPMNEWRLVHLTGEPNQELIDRFKKSESVYLPQFIEVYIREVLKIQLTRKPA
ncbi:MAG: hypothetical protein ABSH03_00670 [Candidatus Lustribacter sp.]|jgi:hypothetical protein